MINPTSENDLNSLQKEFDSRAEEININCGKEFVRISIGSILGLSPAIDNYSTWLLAGCGTIAALMVKSVKAIVPIIGNDGFKISIYLLVFSVIAGLFQKYRALCIQAFSTFSKEIIEGSNTLNSFQYKAFQELNMEAKKYNVKISVKPTIDLNKIQNEFSNLIPFFIRRNAMVNFEKGADDPLHGWRKMIKSFKYQIVYFILQFLFFIIFLVFAAGSV